MRKTKRVGDKPTKTQMAKDAGLSVSYVSRLFSGERRNPSSVTLRALAKAAGVSVEEMMHTLNIH